MREGNRHAARPAPWQGVAALGMLLVSACGGGGGTNSAPPPLAAPTPAPTPSPTPAPASVFDTAEYRRSDGPAFHNAVPAWQLGATGRGVGLGIVDSGIDTSNPEFTGRISSASADVASNRGINDDEGHGTMVALVAGAARDGAGIAGIAWESTILAMRADQPGSCASVDGCAYADTDIARGIDRAVQGGAKVINLSLGGEAPGASVTNAVTRAASAGVVIVVSAGNEFNDPQPDSDPNNPELFAIGLRRAGGGNVIIAGSVGSSGTISAFSNRAGTEAPSYLAALGERICCIYENGQPGNFLVSGTSFSAPQIAGAVALLRQAFPNLSATEVVDLLLRTARDAGAAGTDPVYGRGILDIGRAFAPQGTTTLAGSSAAIAPAATSIATSPAMGDAAVRGASLSAIMLDSYRRAYRMNLSGTMRTAQIAPRLGQALISPMRQVATGSDRLSLAFSVDGRRNAASAPAAGPLSLVPDDTLKARVLAARVVSRISPRATVAFAYAQGADGLVAQVQGASGPAFLVARTPGSDYGALRTGELAAVMRQSFGAWGLTISAESGDVLSAAPMEDALLPVAVRRRSSATRFGVAADRDWGGLDASIEASWLAEDHTVLGARLHPAFGPAGADSLFLDAAAAWRFAPGWRLGAAWRQGFTQPRTVGFVASGSRLMSNAWSFDIARSSLFKPGDTLAFRISQPLRVESGGLSLSLPAEYSYDTLTAARRRTEIPLAPNGREMMGEIAWRGPLWGGMAAASLFYRTNPGHYAASPDDGGAAIMWARQF